MTAHKVYDDGKYWIRIVPTNGYAFDEPIAGWEYIMDLTNGKSYYRHSASNRKYEETPN